MEELISKNDFLELSRRVQARIKGFTWLDRHGYESLMFFIRFGLFILGFVLFAWPSLVYRVLGMLVLAYAYTGIAITGTHETSHLSYVKNSFLNKLWAYFFSDFWSAQSSLWWHFRHVQKHHVYPNVPEKETANFYYPWLNRYFYFFVTPYLVIFWLVGNSVKYLWGKWGHLLAYLVAMIAGWCVHLYLFTTLGYSVFASLGLVFIMRSLFAPLFMHLAVFNHIGLDNPRAVLPWLPRQENTTRNIKPTWFLSGMGGNAFLECHLEHHLFPSLSNHLLAKIRPVVREFLQEKGYLYREEGYRECLAQCLKHYHALFEQRPQAIW